MAQAKGSVVKATKATAPSSGTKTAAAKAPAKKSTSKQMAQAAKAAPAKRAAKTATTKTATTKTATTKTATTKTATTSTAKTAAKSTPAKAAPAKAAAKGRGPAATGTARRGARASSAVLAVREGESPWTADEVAEVRALLESDRERLEVEISTVEEEIGHLLREGGEGAGHDQADVGSNTFERDHEMSIARNARDNLILVKEAIARIDNGGYGVCESCGRPVGKMRLQAFPRATLCMECKQRQERR